MTALDRETPILVTIASAGLAPRPQVNDHHRPPDFCWRSASRSPRQSRRRLGEQHFRGINGLDLQTYGKPTPRINKLRGGLQTRGGSATPPDGAVVRFLEFGRFNLKAA